MLPQQEHHDGDGGERLMFATVESTDGQVYIGTVELREGEVTIFSGRRGRPMVLTDDEVLEILPVNSSNPHIEK